MDGKILKRNCHRCVVTYRIMTEKRNSYKAPGRADRIGISLPEFFRRFPDDAAAEEWFEKQRWPSKTACPRCGSIRVSRVKSRKPMPWHCKDCRKYFSVKYGTVCSPPSWGCRHGSWRCSS